MTDAERKRFRETRPSEWTDAQKADVAEVISDWTTPNEAHAGGDAHVESVRKGKAR